MEAKPPSDTRRGQPSRDIEDDLRWFDAAYAVVLALLGIAVLIYALGTPG